MSPVHRKQKTGKLCHLRQALIAALLVLPLNDALANTPDNPAAAENTLGQAEISDQALQGYRDGITDLEAEYGPYHGQLSQQLMSLGQQYRQQGLLDVAREALQRAMHISRINSGLYSLEQAPILKELAQVNDLRRDWDSLDANQHYMYWIHKRNYGENDPRMLPVLNELGRWHLQAYEDHHNEGNAEHLLRAHDYHRQAIGIVSSHYGDLDPQLLDYLNSYTAINYYLASHQMTLYQEVDRTDSARNLDMDNEDRRRLIQYINNSYRNGKKSIDQTIRIHQHNEQASLVDKINAELAMADWNLLFGRWHTATELYKGIYNQLKTSLTPKLDADNLFAKPVPLPRLPDYDDAEHTHQSSGSSKDVSPYIVATFDVSARGSARNIEFVDEYPKENTQNRIDVRRTLKASKFRPRLEGGEPVQTERFTQKFVFR
ncbi:MAG: hypothetical protein AseanaTS_05790 [Candidatus Pelagadaptatus aseana]|uniref:hypothetical protein n=1 Tax=Candidatus Pelagadaptatus aseana TaxID=3120508 RepID=UPI0039B25AEA